MLVETLLVTVGIPGAVALAIVVAGRFATARHDVTVAGAVCAATLAGSWAIIGRPELAPTDITRWIWHLGALGFTAAVGVATIGRASELRAWAIRIAIAALVAYLVLRPLLGHRWSTPKAAGIAALATGTLAIYWAAAHRVLQLATPRTGATIVLVSIVTSAAAVAASGSLTVAQLGGAAAAGAGAVWLATLVRPAPALGIASVAAPIGWGVVVIGLCYAAMSTRVAILALLPPLAAWLALAIVRRDRLRAAIAIGVAVAIGAAAIGLAMKPPPVEDEAEYGYD